MLPNLWILLSVSGESSILESSRGGQTTPPGPPAAKQGQQQDCQVVKSLLTVNTAEQHYSLQAELIHGKDIFFFVFVVFHGSFSHRGRFLRTSFMFTGRTCAHLNWGIIRQTHQTSRLVQWQSSQRKTLIKYVGSQTRWREATQAGMWFYT